jgi:hypothetical protein
LGDGGLGGLGFTLSVRIHRYDTALVVFFTDHIQIAKQNMIEN